MGRDPALDVVRSYLASRAGDDKRAVRLARSATEEDPEYREGWWTLLWSSLAAHEFADTTRALLLIETQTGTSFGDLKAMPRFAHYVETPEYQTYAKARLGAVP